MTFSNLHCELDNSVNTWSNFQDTQRSLLGLTILLKVIEGNLNRNPKKVDLLIKQTSKIRCVQIKLTDTC